MIGFLSQLTHCIAITLMTCNDKENMEKFTGDPSATLHESRISMT